MAAGHANQHARVRTLLLRLDDGLPIEHMGTYSSTTYEYMYEYEYMYVYHKYHYIGKIFSTGTSAVLLNLSIL